MRERALAHKLGLAHCAVNSPRISSLASRRGKKGANNKITTPCLPTESVGL